MTIDDYFSKGDITYWADVLPEDFELGRSYRLLGGYSIDEKRLTPVYVIPNTETGDYAEDVNAIANLRTFEHDKELQDKVAFGYGGHGYRAVIIPADRPPSEEVRDAIAALSNYPVLDDQAYSEVQNERFQEAWNDHARKDFIREALMPAILRIAKEYRMGFEKDDEQYDEIQDFLEGSESTEAEDIEINKKLIEVWNNVDGYQFQTEESSGLFIDIKRVAKNMAKTNVVVLEDELEPILSLLDAFSKDPNAQPL